MTRRGTAALVVACALSASAAAQQVFRGGTDTVSLAVTVVNSTGRFVTGLSRGEFQVFEDGIPQDVSTFSIEPQPIALSLLIDTSTSMEQKLAVAQEAAVGFVRRLGPADLAQVIDFDSHAVVAQEYTRDVSMLEDAIRRTQAGGSTSLYNALYQAMRTPEYRQAGGADQAIRRWAIVVLSDGEDTSSMLDYEAVLDAAKRSDFAVYAIGLRAKEELPRSGFRESEFVLRSLAQQTGGRSYFVEDVKQLPAVYEQIALELANQYAIGYSSKNVAKDGKWRQVQVRVARPETSARTKAGYFGPKGGD